MPQLIAIAETQSENPFAPGTETNPGWIGQAPSNIIRVYWEVLTGSDGWVPISVGATGSGTCFLPPSWSGFLFRVCADVLERHPAGEGNVLVTYRSDAYGPVG